MSDRFASCFSDSRRADLLEHPVHTLVRQRIFGIALGHEDMNDHDELRCDPLMTRLIGNLEAGRANCAPLAGKSTLNRLELSRSEPSRYHRISPDVAAIEELFVDLLVEAQSKAPTQIIFDLDATDDPVHGTQVGRFFHGYYDGYCYLPLYIFCGGHLLAASNPAMRASRTEGWLFCDSDSPEPVLIKSPLSRQITQDGMSLTSNIVRTATEPCWSLEVINPSDTSIIREDPFPTDKQADQAFRYMLAEEGVQAFFDR